MFYGKINWGHIVCPLYGVDPYLGESIMGGATVHMQRSSTSFSLVGTDAHSTSIEILNVIAEWETRVLTAQLNHR